MTPPWHINNLMLGRIALPSTDGTESAGALLSRAPEAVAAAEVAHEIVRSGSEDLFLRGQPITFAESEFLATYRDIPLERVQNDFNQFLREARAGNRSRYYYLLRASYVLLGRLPHSQVPQLLRQVAGIWQEYASALDRMPDLDTEGRARYLFSATRAARSFYAYLETHEDLDGREEYLPVLRQSMLAMNRQLLGYFEQLATEAPARHLASGGIRRIVELHQALLENNPGTVSRIAEDLQAFLRENPPPADSEEWFHRGESFFLESFPLEMGFSGFLTPPPASDLTIRYEFESLEILTRLLLSLDAANETDSDMLTRRYRPLVAVLQTLILQDPGHGLEHWIQLLADAGNRSMLREILEQGGRENAALSQILSEARGMGSLDGLLDLAGEAARRLREIRGSYGHRLLSDFFRLEGRHHPILRLAQALAERPRAIEAMGWHVSGGDYVRMAIEILNQGEAGRAQLEILEQQSAVLSGTSLTSLFDHATDGLAVGSLQDGVADQLHQLAEDAEEYEMGALCATADYLSRGEGSRYARRITQDLLTHLDSFSYGLQQAVRHLAFSPVSWASLGLGIAVSELLPAFALSRAYRGGNLAAPWLSAFFRAGQMRFSGTVLTGATTGLLMSAMGSGFHNLSRASVGLETHFWRDFLLSSLVNTGSFAVMLPLQRLLAQGVMTPSLFNRAIGSSSRWRAFFSHSTSALAGGSISYGLNILSRGAITGEFTTSLAEGIENYASAGLFEFGAYGFRRAYHRRMLPRELWNPDRMSALFPVLGPRRDALAETTNLFMRANPELQTRFEQVLHLLALEELHFPGNLSRLHRAVEAGHRPELRPGLTDRLVLRSELTAPEQQTLTPVTTIRETPLLLGPGESIPEPERLVFQLDEALEGQGGLWEIYLKPEDREERGDWIFGRREFETIFPETMLPALRRQHLTFRPHPFDPNYLFVTDLAGNPPVQPGSPDETGLGLAYGTWVLMGNHWMRLHPNAPVAIRPGTPLALGRIHDTGRVGYDSGRGKNFDRYPYRQSCEWIAEGSADLSEAVQLTFLTRGARPPHETGADPVADAVTPPPRRYRRISLAPLEHFLIGGMRLIRDKSSSIFRLVGPEEARAEVVGEFGERSRGLYIKGTDNTVVGEIGERVWFRTTSHEGEISEHYLLLDAPDTPADSIPRLLMHFSNQQVAFPLRATSTELIVGRSLHPTLFDSNLISREHFSLSIRDRAGHPRYVLSSLADRGLVIGNTPDVPGPFLAKGQSMDLQAGNYWIYFPLVDNRPDALSNPLTISLPEIRQVFPEWGLDHLLPNHDRGFPYATPAAAPAPTVHRLSPWQQFRAWLRSL